MASRILVTGATGNVGGRVLNRLYDDARTHDVVVAGVRNSEKGAKLESRGIPTVHLDFDDPASVVAAMQGIDRLFLLTGYSIDMLVQSKIALDAAKRAGVSHVVHLGAGGSDTQPFAHLAWHAYVESYIEARGFGYTHLRPRTYMDNLLRVIRPGSTVIRQFYGMSPVAWIAIDDIAAAAGVALNDPQAHLGKTYELVSEVAPMPQVVATLARETGLPFTYEPMVATRALDVLGKTGMDPAYAKSLAGAIMATAEGRYMPDTRVDGTLEQILGRPPLRWADFAAANRAVFMRAGQPGR
jgi:NAD(P)H dehydrogenase (quinone)